MAEAKCAVCGKAVATGDQLEHLRSNHLGPHYFWFNGKKYRTEEPSMAVTIIKRMAEADPSYHLFEERSDGPDVYYGDSEVVDLTRQPHLWCAPPATMWG